ncbi:MAG: M20/M25/M40 family metallo-hydrolase [Vicinamibacterales bacterium]|nr:M20/M25/M40 family metallo-hydrolase [Vicinamibacterales bacterium]
MRHRRPFVLASAALVVSLSSVPLAQQPAQTSPPGPDRALVAMHGISSHTILDWVKEMASEKYAGRLSGTAEYDACADWTAGLLKSWKYKPAGDNGTYLQKFPNPYTLVKPGTELTLHLPLAGGVTVKKAYTWETEYFQGATSDSGTMTADTVYVGFGITAPELGYDDYAGVDVKGKIVVVEPEVPMGPAPDADLFKKWRPYSFHDYKMKNAVQHGAAGMVYNYHIVNPNGVFLKGLLLSYVGRAVMDDLFAGRPATHAQTLDQIRKTLKPASQALGKTLTIRNTTEHHPDGITSNVIATLPGTDPVLKDEAVIIGAHLDHLGYSHELMPGAHDNASGAAVLLAVAEALSKANIPLKRTLVFILFGAEEQGVKGSEYYVAHPVVPNARVTAFINLESVGRGERINVGSGKDHPQIFEAMERANNRFVHRTMTASANANLARPRQDAAHFLWAGIPTVSVGVSGAPALPYASYHTTKDRWEILMPETMEDLARVVFLSTLDLAGR